MSAWAAPAVVVLLLTTITVGIELLEVHGPDGQTTWLSERAISTLRQPNAVDLGRFFPAHTRCVIVTTNGKFVAAVETCQQLRDRMTQPPAR